MAWNEPGNNGGRDKDPWGNNNRGGREQGPPDLDEVFSKLSRKFGGILGNKKGPSTGGSAVGLGVIAVLERNPIEALPYLEAARSSDPQDATTRLYLGLVLEALDRHIEAAVEYENALEMSNDPALVKLAETHLQMIQH